MKKVFVFAVLLCMALLAPCKMTAQVTATIVEQELTPSVTDVDSDYREYVSVSYTIKVEGAGGHTLRVEVPWLDMKGKAVYFNIDEKEIAMTSQSYYIESDSDTIVGWVGTYHDAFWLKPGVHKLNGTIRIFDETLGKYIMLNGAAKQTFSYTSYKKAPGVKIVNNYIEHNQYHNNSKGMYVRYGVEANWMKNANLRFEVILYRANGTVIYNTSGKVDKTTTTNNIPDYTFCIWNDLYSHFPYSGMKLPKGKTNCYALIKVFDAKTGKLLATSNKMEFYFTK